MQPVASEEAVNGGLPSYSTTRLSTVTPGIPTTRQGCPPTMRFVGRKELALELSSYKVNKLSPLDSRRYCNLSMIQYLSIIIQTV